MSQSHFQALLDAYRSAPELYQATSYWSAYEDELLRLTKKLDPADLQSGKHRMLSRFGFETGIYHRRFTRTKQILLRLLGIRMRHLTPYSLRAEEVQEMAYRRALDVGALTGAKSVSNIESSGYGNPKDLFEIAGKRYTVALLGFYLRYCFAQKHIPFDGGKIYIELGSGSGHQVEVLKQLHPDLTILCFDMPAQIYLCQMYLTGALGAENIVSSEETVHWDNLEQIKPGGIHFFGNWQLPMIADIQPDIFWNAHSFAEMEPHVAANYLSFVAQGTNWVYLEEERTGQKTTGAAHVKTPITFEMYNEMLPNYGLREEEEAYSAIQKIRGPSFRAVWSKQA